MTQVSDTTNNTKCIIWPSLLAVDRWSDPTKNPKLYSDKKVVVSLVWKPLFHTNMKHIDLMLVCSSRRREVMFWFQWRYVYIYIYIYMHEEQRSLKVWTYIPNQTLFELRISNHSNKMQNTKLMALWFPTVASSSLSSLFFLLLLLLLFFFFLFFFSLVLNLTYLFDFNSLFFFL